MNRDGYPEYLSKLNDAQFEAATTIEGPQLILAGAGSGKTTVLINRLAFMVDRGIDPRKILLLTFTNAAAENMQKRAEKLSDESCRLALCCTFHSFCVKVLRMFGERISIPKEFSIITGADVSGAIKIVKSRAGYSSLKEFPSCDSIANGYSYARNTETDWEEMVHASIEDPEVARAVLDTTNKYEQYKSENALLDYDDLLFKTAELLEISDVRDALEEMYSYVMVDEYQDTNHVQERIVFALTKKNRNLCVVGDDYQSIYAFRGADVNGILTFPKKIPYCKVTKVLTNYRSTEQILEIPNRMMAANAHFGFPKSMDSGVGEGKYPALYMPVNEEEEANLMFEQIKSWLRASVPASEIAVLSRTAVSTARLEAMLTKNGIPFIKRGGVKFFEMKCIVDMLSIFRCVSNSTDEIAWFNLLDLIPGIGDAYANKILKNIGTDSFLVCPEFEKKPFYGELMSLADTISLLRRSSKTLALPRLFKVARNFYERIALSKVQNAKVTEDKRSEMMDALNASKEYVDVLENIAQDYNSIPDFLDGCTLGSKDPDEEKKCVTVSTIHSAKGMEWNHVWVRGLSDGCIPKMGEEDKEIEEDLRCLYVALTRPRKELFMSAPQESLINGTMVATPLTRFLKNVVNEDNCCIKVSKVKEPKVYLYVPFSSKDIAKKYGARWDGAERSWYIPAGLMGENREKLLRMFGR